LPNPPHPRFWLRYRFFQTRFAASFASVALGGAIIAGISAALGSA
jgi:erythrin-vacuolar iron transport family protein